VVRYPYEESVAFDSAFTAAREANWESAEKFIEAQRGKFGQTNNCAFHGEVDSFLLRLRWS
jgi:hypothetical protein